MKILKILGYVLSVTYSVFIFLSLTVFHFPIRLVGLLVLLLASAMIISRTSKKGRLLPCLMLLIALIVIITKSDIVLKCYPVIVNLVFLITFSLSLRQGDSIIFYFANLGDKTIAWNGGKNEIKRYCRKVNYVWVCFFILNITIATFTVFWSGMKLWMIWNGCLSYIAMGLLFTVEFIVRVIKQKKDSKPVLFTNMNDKSRPDDFIVSYSCNWNDEKYKYWSDYKKDTSSLRYFLKERKETKILIHSDDFYFFIVALTSVLLSGKKALVSSNISKDFVSSIADDDTLLLLDVDIYADKKRDNLFIIKDVIEKYYSNGLLPLESINPTSLVYLFTSGSTGNPKPVEHYFSELESDNDCLGKRWRGKFQKKIEISSVNPHHAFGIVFAAIKPFIHGVPIRQEKLESPLELTVLGDEHYLFITSPSFLTVSLKDPVLSKPLGLKSPFIINAGGPLKREDGTNIEKIYGVRPLDIYGSTETGAIAWRINSNEESEWWTPMAGVEFSLMEDGCLAVKADGVHGDGLFHTADLAEFRQDGKFLLNGRKDSIVKIAEKRISLDEVENRLISTSFISDAKVVLLKGKEREYLGAAVVLSPEGHNKLDGKTSGECFKFFRQAVSGYLEGVTIPRKWRIVDNIPKNSMGKIQMNEVLSLFSTES